MLDPKRLRQDLDGVTEGLARRGFRLDREAFSKLEEQRKELQQDRDRRARLQQELREVRQRLDAEINALGTRLKLLNILAMPVLVALAALIVFGIRRRRRRRAAPGIS